MTSRRAIICPASDCDRVLANCPRLAAHLRSSHPRTTFSRTTLHSLRLSHCPQCRAIWTTRGLAIHSRACHSSNSASADSAITSHTPPHTAVPRHSRPHTLLVPTLPNSNSPPSSSQHTPLPSSPQRTARSGFSFSSTQLTHPPTSSPPTTLDPQPQSSPPPAGHHNALLPPVRSRHPRVVSRPHRRQRLHHRGHNLGLTFSSYIVPLICHSLSRFGTDIPRANLSRAQQLASRFPHWQAASASLSSALDLSSSATRSSLLRRLRASGHSRALYLQAPGQEAIMERWGRADPHLQQLFSLFAVRDHTRQHSSTASLLPRSSALGVTTPLSLHGPSGDTLSTLSHSDSPQPTIPSVAPPSHSPLSPTTPVVSRETASPNASPPARPSGLVWAAPWASHTALSHPQGVSMQSHSMWTHTAVAPPVISSTPLTRPQVTSQSPTTQSHTAVAPPVISSNLIQQSIPEFFAVPSSSSTLPTDTPHTSSTTHISTDAELLSTTSLGPGQFLAGATVTASAAHCSFCSHQFSLDCPRYTTPHSCSHFRLLCTRCAQEALAASGACPVCNTLILDPLRTGCCVICQSEFGPSVQPAHILPCGHSSFCRSCLLHQFSTVDNRCPVCRAPTPWFEGVRVSTTSRPPVTNYDYNIAEVQLSTPESLSPFSSPGLLPRVGSSPPPAFNLTSPQPSPTSLQHTPIHSPNVHPSHLEHEPPPSVTQPSTPTHTLDTSSTPHPSQGTSPNPAQSSPLTAPDISSAPTPTFPSTSIPILATRLPPLPIPSSAQFATHGRIWSTIPETCWPRWQSLARATLEPFAHALLNEDPQLLELSLLHFLYLPQSCLRRVRGGRHSRATRSLNLALSRALTSLRTDSQLTAPDLSSLPPRPSDPRAATLSRVTELIRAGHLSRAIRLLNSPGLAPPTDSTIEALRRLHPPGPDVALPRPPASRPILIVEPARLRSLISRLNTGASPGPSGLSFAHLIPLAADPVCLELLCQLVRLIGNGEFPRSLRHLLVASLLSAGSKPGSSSVRPIANGEVLLQLTAHYLLDSVVSALPAIFPSIQLGVGVSGGSQRAVHLLQAFIDTSHTLCDDPLLVSLDVSNAFNTRDRGQLLDILYANPTLSPLHSIVDFAYSETSDLLFRNTHDQFVVLHSEQGLRQGDVLATLLYSLSVQQFYTHSLALDSTLTGVAVIDDLHIGGSSLAVLTAVDRYSESLQDSGLQLHPTKGWAMWLGLGPPPPSLSEDCSRRSLRLLPGPYVRSLGSFIGRLTDPTQVLNFLEGRLAPIQELFTGISDLARFEALSAPSPSLQCALLALRYCALATPAYILRTLPPDHTAPFCRQFDDLLTRTLAELLVLPTHLTPEASHDIYQPLRLGGLGFRPLLRTRHFAYFAAAVSAAQVTVPLVEGEESTFLSHTSSSFLPFAAAVHSCLQHFNALGFAPDNSIIFPTTLETFTHFSAHPPPNGLQRILTGLFETALDRRYMSHINAFHTARTLSARAPNASAWLNTIPTDSTLTLNNTQICLAIRHRLGLPPADTLPRTCACNASLSLRVPDHFQACPFLRRRAVTHRHDAVGRTIARLARDSGCLVLLEDHQRVGDWVDFEFFLPSSHIISDLSITNPTNSSILNSSTHQLGAARARQEAKRRRYSGLAASLGALNLPFIIESHGALGPDASHLLRLFRSNFSTLTNSHTAPQAFFVQSVRRISITLQRYNAHISRMGLQYARAHSRAIPPNPPPP